MRSQFDFAILDAINNAFRTIKASPLILGGVSGSGGGAGGPVGGYVGYLPQTRVAYDTDELAFSGFLESGAFDEDGDIVSGSLLDNLNHIRWRLSVLESASGGGEATSFLDLSDTPDSYATFSGYVVMVNATEDGLEFGFSAPSSGGSGTPGGANTNVQYNNGGVLGGDAEFTWDDITKTLGIGDPAGLPGISPDHTFWMVGDGVSPSQFMVAYGATRAAFTSFMKADGSVASPANVKADQVIGRIRGRGHDGTGWTDTRVEIRFVADGDWGSGDTPTRIELWTCPDGSSTLTLAMTIGSDGIPNIATGTYNINGSPHTHAERLLISSASVTTGNVTGVEGTLHSLDISGMTANRDFNLPTPSAAGVLCGVRVSTGDDTYELIVKINGVEWNRLFITNEYVLFISTGTGAGNWDVKNFKLVPSTCRISNSTTDTLTHGVSKQLTFDTAVNNPHGMADLANDRIKIRRAGTYKLSGTFQLDSGVRYTRVLGNLIISGGGEICRAETDSSSTSGFPVCTFVTVSFSLTAGQYIIMNGYQTNASTRNKATIAAITNMAVTESV